jgi:hypothetical protein
MKFLPIGRNLKRAATARDQLEGTYVLLQLEKLLRQTDGMRFVVSSRTVLNGDFKGHNYLSIQLEGRPRVKVGAPGHPVYPPEDL